MTFFRRLVLAPAERITDALVDPSRRERAVAGLLLMFVAAYTVYALVARSSQDVHSDVGELISWSRQPALGYNHPPLSAWVAQAWFSVFPRQDWAANLLAMSVSASALWVSWKLFADWLDDTKRVVALAMLTLVPFYAFHALIFNANTVMMPLWAAASLFFLRSFRTHAPAPAAAAGVASAAALLGKYWSVHLVAGFGLAALLDHRRAAYFRSAAPWISIGVALLVLAPHLIWLATGHASTLAFALSTTDANPSLWRSFRYVPDAAAYVVVPLLAFALTRPSRAAIADVLLPADADRRLVAMVFWIALLLPVLLNLFLPSRLTAIWSIPNWTLFPIVLLGSPLVIVTRKIAVWVVAAALVLPLAALLAAPAVSIITHLNNAAGSRAHYRALAQRVETLWRNETRAPLRLVGGEKNLAEGSIFYLHDPALARPEHLLDLPAGRTEVKLNAASAERIARDGIVLLCAMREAYCVAALDKMAERLPGRREEFELTRSHFGIAGTPTRYLVFAVRPSVP